MPYLRKKPRAIILDLDNTLYVYAPAHQAGLSALQNLFKAEFNLTAASFIRLYRRSRRLVKKRFGGTALSHSRLLYIKAAFDELRINQPRRILSFESAYWKAYFRQMKIYRDIPPFLALMKKNAIAVAIVSDLTLRIQLEKVIHLKVDRFIRLILTSEETGFEKPSLNNFRQACLMMDVPPRLTWVIGDDKARDLPAAIGIGAWPVIINRSLRRRRVFHPEFLEIDSFSELKEIFKEALLS